MRALVGYESMFGNTQSIAREIAAGLAESMDVDLVDVAVALKPALAPYDLVVLGGPTHALSMSTPLSRAEASKRGARSGVQTTGLREWMPSLGPPFAGRVATFDTRWGRLAWLPGSAARAATKALRRMGCESVERPRSFRVRGERGPLYDGELDRARAWARELASRPLSPR